MASSCTKRSSGFILGQIYSWKDWLSTGEAVQGSDEVTVPGSVQKTSRSGTSLNGWFSGHSGNWWKVGLEGLGGLYQPMILSF